MWSCFFSEKNILCLEPSVSSGIDRYRIFWVSLSLGIDWVKSCDRPPLPGTIDGDLDLGYRTDGDLRTGSLCYSTGSYQVTGLLSKHCPAREVIVITLKYQEVRINLEIFDPQIFRSVKCLGFKILRTVRTYCVALT